MFRRAATAIRRTALVAIVMLAAVGTAGCIGIGWSGTERVIDADPRSTYPLTRQNGPLSTDELVATLGEPDQRSAMSDCEERWTYVRGVRWCGVTVYAVIGVPLLLPVGLASDTYHVLDGVVAGVDRVSTHDTNLTCGFIPGYCTGWGCERW